MNVNNTSKSYKWGCELKGRSSVSGRNTSLQRAVSDGVEFGGLQRQRFNENEKEAHRRSYIEERDRHKYFKGLQDHVLSSPRSSMQREQAWPSRDPLGTIQERIQAVTSKSRMGEVSARRPKG